MFKLFALLLILPLFTVSLAQGAPTGNAQLYRHFYQEHIQAQVSKAQTEFNKYHSWKDLQKAIKDGIADEVQKKKILEDLKQVASGPFVKPVFTAAPNGFSLSLQKEKLTFDLVKKEMRHKKRIFPMEGKAYVEMLEWIRKSDKKFSLMNFIIPEAHAQFLDNLSIVSYFSVSLSTLWNSHKTDIICEHNLKELEDKVQVIVNHCEEDVNSTVVSSETEEFLFDLKTKHFHSLVGAVGAPATNRLDSCEQAIQDNFKKKLGLNAGKVCGEAGTENRICHRLDMLNICIRRLQQKAADVNNSEQPKKSEDTFIHEKAIWGASQQ